MKIIFSRKGFDSSFGGIASPILEDGTMISFPIPSSGDKDTYSDLFYNGESYRKILKDLGYKGGSHCHLDPDLHQGRRKERIEGWVPAFGQAGGPTTYLRNIGVKEGDIFLFFGNYHFVEKINGKYRFVKGTGDFYKDNDIQIIWGYLQVGEILETEVEQRKLWWHPHSSSDRAGKKTNIIFTANKKLSLDEKKPGAGILTYDKKRVLTLEGCSKATWIRNEVYDLKHIDIIKSRKNSAKNPHQAIYYAGIWQELGLKESRECTEWAKMILAD